MCRLHGFDYDTLLLFEIGREKPIEAEVSGEEKGAVCKEKFSGGTNRALQSPNIHGKIRRHCNRIRRGYNNCRPGGRPRFQSGLY